MHWLERASRTAKGVSGVLTVFVCIMAQAMVVTKLMMYKKRNGTAKTPWQEGEGSTVRTNKPDRSKPVDAKKPALTVSRNKWQNKFLPHPEYVKMWVMGGRCASGAGKKRGKRMAKPETKLSVKRLN